MKPQNAKPLRDIKAIIMCLADIRAKHQEHLVVLSLGSGHYLLAQRIVAIGALDCVIAHPREIFADVISDRAASVIVAHNHPSGDARPSRRDITLTQQLAAAGQLLGILLDDHIIVTVDDHFSFRENGLL